MAAFADGIELFSEVEQPVGVSGIDGIDHLRDDLMEHEGPGIPGVAILFNQRRNLIQNRANAADRPSHRSQEGKPR